MAIMIEERSLHHRRLHRGRMDSVEAGEMILAMMREVTGRLRVHEAMLLR